MKILHVLHSFPPNATGGTEAYVGSIVEAQRGHGDRPIVLAWSGAYRGEGVRVSTRAGVVPVLELDAARLPLEALVEGRSEGVTTAFLSLLVSERPDVVHVHHWHGLTHDLVDCCVRAGVPAVVSLHDLFSTCPLFFRLPDSRTVCPPETTIPDCVRCVSDTTGLSAAVLTRAFAKRFGAFREELQSAHRVLALSRSEQAFLREMPLFHDIDLEVLPLPAIGTRRRQGAGRRPRDAGRLRLVSWGGLVPGKGMGTLVEACERLAEPERVSVDHFGRALDPGFRNTLETIARRVRLTIHGPYPPGDAYDRFSQFDVAVFPSLFLETHGFVVDEAIDYGLPVLVSDRGAPKERIGECGAVFPGGDADALAALIQQLLDDPQRLESMLDAVRVAQPTTEEHRAALDQIYRDAISAPRPIKS